MEYDRDARLVGRSKYTQRAMVRLAFDAIVGFSALPLRVASMLGLLVSFLGTIYFVYGIGVRVLTDDAVQGLDLRRRRRGLLGGVQLARIGIIGQYLGRMYDELTNRPLFVVRTDTHREAALRRDPQRPAPEPAAPLGQR